MGQHIQTQLAWMNSINCRHLILFQMTAGNMTAKTMSELTKPPFHVLCICASIGLSPQNLAFQRIKNNHLGLYCSIFPCRFSANRHGMSRTSARPVQTTPMLVFPFITRHPADQDQKSENKSHGLATAVVDQSLTKSLCSIASLTGVFIRFRCLLSLGWQGRHPEQGLK